jgi:DNA-binding PadR family transcriptional regulator
MTSAKLPTTSYAVLGLLSIHQMAGYDLAQATDRSIANFWPISRSQVYGELGRLEKLGFVRGTDVAQERLPDKRVFEITDEGRAALEGWLGTPDFEPDRIRLGFCVKMFFGHHMPRETIVKMIENYRAENMKRVEYLKCVVEMLGALPAAAYVRSTAMLGLRTCEAAIAWTEEMLASLPDLEKPETPEDHDRLHETARELFEKAPPRSKI